MYILAVLIAACSTEEATVQRSPEERFELGKAKFDAGDYLDAIEEFRVITLQFPGTAFADDAQFYMAEARFKREEYILAAHEYDVLIRTMPTSEFVPRARYQRAMCYYHLSPRSYLDQEYTRRAIDEFQTFLEYHPTDPLAEDAAANITELNTKLAKKEFENGMIYMRLQSYRAAVYYFDLVLERFHDTPYAEKALFMKAEALFQRRRYNEAFDEINRFLARYPDSAERARAERLRQDIIARMSESNRNTSRESDRQNLHSMEG
jgi:outer membrane protein assembly factor BamD